MPDHTPDELRDAQHALASTLAKCEKALAVMRPEAKSQRTLLERRISALQIALDLIANELESRQDATV